MSRHEYILKLPIIQDVITLNNVNKQDIPIMINYPTSDMFIFVQDNINIQNKEYYNFTSNKYIPLIDTSVINNLSLFDKYYNIYEEENFKKWDEYANNYYYFKYMMKNSLLDNTQFYTKYNNKKLNILLMNYPEKYNNLIYNLMNNYNYNKEENNIIDNISLSVNSKERFDCDKDYLLNINNYQFYNHDIKGLYTYSFGLNTKELQPSEYVYKPFIS